MALEIVRASTELLTTLAAAKLEIGLTTAQTSDDARITALIGSAGRWAESYVGYPLLAAKYRETVAGYGLRRLMVARRPIRAVTGLYFGTDTGDDNTQQIPSTEFGVESEPGFLTRLAGWDWTVPIEDEVTPRPVPGQEYEPWLVDYIAGFTLDGMTTDSALWSTEKGTTSTGRTLPEDIELAIQLKVASLYGRSDYVVEKRIGDLHIKVGTAPGGGIADQAADILSPYRSA